MKQIFTSVLLLFCIKPFAQQNYNDFEGNKTASLAEWNGVMDSTHVNPMPNSVNMSSVCAKYIRDTALYDNFKFFPYAKLTDVSPYASSTATSKITMKVFTSSAPGTQIDLQLGTRTNTTYPAGVHSIYTATTSVQNAWQTLTFNFVMTPPGSTTLPTDIDKIVVFVRPNSHARDTIYFDDPTGPSEIVIGMKENTTYQLSVMQNEPNPANTSTAVKFTLNKPGAVKLNVTDIYGKQIREELTANYPAGQQLLTLNTSDFAAGIYFYTVETEGYKQTRKMIVNH